MAAASERPIEIAPVKLHGQTLHRFTQHHRDVPQLLGALICIPALGHAALPLPLCFCHRAFYRRNSAISSVISPSPTVWRVVLRCSCSLHNSNLSPMPSNTAFFSMPVVAR